MNLLSPKICSQKRRYKKLLLQGKYLPIESSSNKCPKNRSKVIDPMKRPERWFEFIVHEHCRYYIWSKRTSGIHRRTRNVSLKKKSLEDNDESHTL